MNDLSSLKGKLLVEKVEEQIFQYIIKTPVPVGTKLPNEFRLGEMFGVGRSTIREAVRSLVFRGVLEVRRGSGTYVVNPVPVEEDPLGIQNFEDKGAIAMDLVDVRLMIEPAMAETAARKATEEQVEHLRYLCDVVEQKILADEDYIKADIEFHCFLAECSQNKIVEQLIPILDTAVLMFVNITHKRLREETIKTHRGIVDAIAERDLLGARMAMTMHINYNREMIKQVNREESENRI